MMGRGDKPDVSGPIGRTLGDIAHVVQSAEETEQRVRRVLELLGRLGPYERCALLVAGLAGQPRLVIHPEPSKEEQESVRARLERLFELLEDRTSVDLADLWAGATEPTLWQSHLSVPLIGVDGVLGVLAVGRESPDGYDDEDLSRLSAVASQLGAYLTALQAREREFGEADATARALDVRAGQQAAVADLSQLALTGVDLRVVMDETVARVAQCLDVEYAKVLELAPDGKALLSSEPVIVEDLRSETHFGSSPLLCDHGVVSGMSVIVPSRERPFRVLGVHTTRRRRFTPDDTSFLQAVANILATVIERKHGEAREQFLARVSEVLASSIDYQTALNSVAQLVVPYLADWCLVDSVAQDGGVQRMAVAHVDPAKAWLAVELQHRYLPDPNGAFGVPKVLRTGKPELYPEIPDGLLEAVARDAEHLRMLRQLGLRSAIVVPLVARGRTLGALSFFAAESVRHYDATDLNLAQELAHRAAVAIENARLNGELQSQVEAHARLNQDLRRLTGERDGFRRVAEERVAALEHLDRVREEFIATTSHDLRSPLTSIRGYAQLLSRRLLTPAPDLEEVAQGLEVINRQVTAMAQLVDGLLDAVRIQAGAFELWTGRCDLRHCLDTVLARLNPEERERVRIRFPDPPLAGDWDQKRIEQVLANLVGNALKYSPEGEPVSVVVERDSGGIEVAVSDRGMGIPPEELPGLFERFHRTPQARASGLSGTGLGLYVCRGVVEAHGGRIRAESDGEGQGATFRFTLPTERPVAGAGAVRSEGEDEHDGEEGG